MSDKFKKFKSVNMIISTLEAEIIYKALHERCMGIATEGKKLLNTGVKFNSIENLKLLNEAAIGAFLIEKFCNIFDENPETRVKPPESIKKLIKFAENTINELSGMPMDTNPN